MKLLRRKIDNYLKEWKSDKERMPLIVKGARQVGKTASILQFAYDNYQNVVAINFVLQQNTRQSSKKVTRWIVSSGTSPSSILLSR